MLRRAKQIVCVSKSFKYFHIHTTVGMLSFAFAASYNVTTKVIGAWAFLLPLILSGFISMCSCVCCARLKRGATHCQQSTCIYIWHTHMHNTFQICWSSSSLQGRRVSGSEIRREFRKFMRNARMSMRFREKLKRSLGVKKNKILY